MPAEISTKVMTFMGLKMGVLVGVAGVLVGIIVVLSQTTACVSADGLCYVGDTETFSSDMNIYGGTPYKTTVKTVNTANRLITLPDADTTVIGASSTDTLENKTINFNDNTGSNYDANTLTGSILPATVVNSSVQNLGIQSSVELGSNLTTLTEPGAGDVAIETKTIYRANGTTIPVDDGGTGVTSLPTGHALIGNDASAITTVDMTTQGHLLAGDGTGPPSALAVGNNGEFLTADSAEPTGMKWDVAPAGGYSVVDAYSAGAPYGSVNPGMCIPSSNRTAPTQLTSSEGFRNGGIGNVGSWSQITWANTQPYCSPANSGYQYSFAETGYYEVAVSMCGTITQWNYMNVYMKFTNDNWATGPELGGDDLATVYTTIYAENCVLAEGIIPATSTTDSHFVIRAACGGCHQFYNTNAGIRIWIKKIADI